MSAYVYIFFFISNKSQNIYLNSCLNLLSPFFSLTVCNTKEACLECLPRFARNSFLRARQPHVVCFDGKQSRLFLACSSTLYFGTVTRIYTNKGIHASVIEIHRRGRCKHSCPTSYDVDNDHKMQWNERWYCLN
jgi:hypothetical protein